MERVSIIFYSKLKSLQNVKMSTRIIAINKLEKTSHLCKSSIWQIGILIIERKLIKFETILNSFYLISGVGMVTRKMGATVSPVVELTEKDGVYTLKTTSTFKNTEIKFKLGEEFDEETVDGRKVKSICTLDGNKLVQVQKGDKDTTIDREFTPTEMKAVSNL